MLNQNTESSADIDAQTARIALHGRILRCPIGDNPPDCPLYEIRKLPIEKRLEWLALKTDDEVIALYHYHVKCIAEKTAV